jgi:cyclic beta-1,2-glucan synthetase
MMVFLPDYAGLTLNAIARVAYRRLKSHRLLLEWETAQEAHHRARNQEWQFVLARLWIPGLAVLLLILLAYVGPVAVLAALPFLTLWILFPLAVLLINRPATTIRGGILSLADRKMLRATARRTWRYFDDFVGPETHWLPPDNVQEVPTREIFLRTSPTNIGLWMLATVAANDFGYVTLDDLTARNLATLETLGQLELFEGHLLNWYDIKKLEPLHPRYVSTVDSGNLIASLWTFTISCVELTARSVLDGAALRGLADTLAVVRQVAGTIDEANRPPALASLERLTASPPENLVEIIARLRSAREPAKELAQTFFTDEGDPRAYWPRQVEKQVEAWNGIIDRYLRPLEILAASPAQLMSLGTTAHECRRDALAATYSLRNIASAGITGMATLVAFQLRRDELQLPPPVGEWLDSLVTEVARAEQNATQQLAQIDEIIGRSEALERGIDLRFLYDEQRRIFAIGYQVGERRLDDSFYDLLASEARLTSLLAIARGDVLVATQIADALDRAHRAGVTHRDVKPQNIMLTRDGVKVLDFGLAKSASKPAPAEATLTAVLTAEGTVMGTPQYMAPEQFAGKEADARSDIWAFGAVLYEMVTGRKAFHGSNYQSLVGAILATDPAPMAVKPFTPSWLERLVRRCLAKNPDDRWQCAAFSAVLYSEQELDWPR